MSVAGPTAHWAVRDMPGPVLRQPEGQAQEKQDSSSWKSNPTRDGTHPCGWPVPVAPRRQFLSSAVASPSDPQRH